MERKCEYCNKEHDGSYGSGRFCNKSCVAGYATRDKRNEINKKISKSLRFILCERICPNCGKYFQPTNMRHTFCNKVCSGKYYAKNNFPTNNKLEHLKQSNGTYKCPECDRTFITIHGLHPHFWRAHTEEGMSYARNGLGGPGWNKGLTKETDERVKRAADAKLGRHHTKETKEKLSKVWLGKKHTKKTKSKISKKRKEWFKNGGTNPNAGRCMKYHYQSSIAGEISLDGTWELQTAIFFDCSELKWRRNTKGFKYINPETKQESIYIPDFYVYDWNTYIEVKGYISEIDKAKWKQFQEPLEIWDENKLREYGIIL